MKQNIWNVILGISLAVLLGLTTDYWWPFGEKAEEEQQEVAPAATNDDNNTTTTTVGVGVDFSIKLKKEESTTTSTAQQTTTTTPFISKRLEWYNNMPKKFFEKEVVNGHLQILGLDLKIEPDLIKENSEGYYGYILIFFDENDRKVTKIKGVRNTLHLSQEDLSLVTDTLIVDNLGNRYQLPIRANVENVGVIGVLDEYVVTIEQAPSKLPKRLGCLSVIFIVIGIVIYLLTDTENKLAIALVIVGVILAVIGACIL